MSPLLAVTWTDGGAGDVAVGDLSFLRSSVLLSGTRHGRRCRLELDLRDIIGVRLSAENGRSVEIDRTGLPSVVVRPLIDDGEFFEFASVLRGAALGGPI